MKTLLLALGLFLVSGPLFAQFADFEQWQSYTLGSTAFEIPNGWHSVDSSIIAYGHLLNPTGTFVAQTTKNNFGVGVTNALN